MVFCKNLDKSFHIVSKKILVNKGLRIFVFLNEATLDFFTFCSLPGYFRQIICSNIILISFEGQCEIYWRYQIRSWIQNQSILSRDISLFLTQLLQNHRHQKFQISPVFNIKLLFWSFFIIIKCFLYN
jgi:hypothetical protein